MSLDFEFKKGIRRELIEYRQKDGSLHWLPRAQSFVFYQMLLQHDIDGEQKDEKLIEICRRIDIINACISTHAHWYTKNEEYQHQMADVITYWGLTTNVTHLSKAKWNAWFNRAYERRCRERFTQYGFQNAELKPFRVNPVVDSVDESDAVSG